MFCSREESTYYLIIQQNETSAHNQLHWPSQIVLWWHLGYDIGNWRQLLLAGVWHQCWHRFHILFGCWGKVLLWLSLLEFKGLPFWMPKHSCHMCPPALAVISLDLFMITPPAWFWLLLAVSLFQLPLPLGPWAIVTGILIVISLTPVGSLLWGVFNAFWAPLTTAINCCGISTHFTQGSWVGATGSELVFPSLPMGTSLTTPDLEAQELLCSCLCSSSAFLAVCIRTMWSFTGLSNLAWITSWRGFLRP